jgi:hypothetical protein
VEFERALLQRCNRLGIFHHGLHGRLGGSLEGFFQGLPPGVKRNVRDGNILGS